MIPGEVTEIPEGEVIIASGPLTSDALAETLQGLLGEHSDLHFFDAAAPLVSAESVVWNTPGWVPGMIRARTIM